MSYILGISAFYHDSAATLIKDGEIVYSHSGKLSAEALSAEIDKHLS